MAPAYISDLINVRKHAHYSLRSNSGTILLHPAGKMKKSFGDRSFSVIIITRHHMWVEGLLLVLILAPGGFFPGTLVFPINPKTNISKFQFDLEIVAISALC